MNFANLKKHRQILDCIDTLEAVCTEAFMGAGLGLGKESPIDKHTINSISTIIVRMRRALRAAPAGAGAGVPEDWRVRAATWLNSEADAQESRNRRYPDHVAAYASWTQRVWLYRELARKVVASDPEQRAVPDLAPEVQEKFAEVDAGIAEIDAIVAAAKTAKQQGDGEAICLVERFLLERDEQVVNAGDATDAERRESAKLIFKLLQEMTEAEAFTALAARQPVGQDQREGCEGAMPDSRVAFFLGRFRRVEKLLGPHEQWALDVAISRFEQCSDDQPVGQEVNRG